MAMHTTLSTSSAVVHVGKLQRAPSRQNLVCLANMKSLQPLINPHILACKIKSDETACNVNGFAYIHQFH